MELSAPRWGEAPTSLTKSSGAFPSHAPPVAADVLARVAVDAKWNSMLTKMMASHVERLQTYLGLRETGKHYLMRGYAEIRRTLLELDRQFKLDGGIFFLQYLELPCSSMARTSSRKSLNDDELDPSN